MRQVLVITDHPEAWSLVAPVLQAQGFALSWAVSASHALVRLDVTEQPWSLVLCDLRGDEESLRAAELLMERHRALPVVLSCDDNGISLAVRALRAGVAEVVERPLDAQTLVASLTRAARPVSAPVTRDDGAFDEVVGRSDAMRRLYRVMRRVADRDFTVLLSGETGSGRELVARALHASSRRAAGPFVAVNCAALPASLLESELFGHVANAFTDAGGERLGLFRSASGGTLFLDAVGELPRSLQPKLLRVLQERTVRPLGASREVPVDVRVICSATGDLRDAIEAGAFREDLFFRLDVVRVEVPPLRARGTDVLLLAEHRLAQHAQRTGAPLKSLSLEVAARLLEYGWPGNVRELFAMLDGVVVMHDELVITSEQLPPAIRNAARPASPQPTAPTRLPTWAEIEKGYVLQVLHALNGNKRRAAELLGLDRTTLYRKLQTWT